MTQITTHVLDTQYGFPASNIAVKLGRVSNHHCEWLSRAITNSKGRVTEWDKKVSVISGVYRLEFLVGDYFLSQSIESFFPSISIDFNVNSLQEHYHVPLLLSPFGYSTYRGS